MTDRLASLAAWAADAAAGTGPLEIRLLSAGDAPEALRRLAAHGDVELEIVAGGAQAGEHAADRAADAGIGAVIVTTSASPTATAALVGLLTRANAAKVTAPDADDVAWMDACERVREAMTACRACMGDVDALLAALDDEALTTATGVIRAASNRGLGVILDDAGACAAALVVARGDRASARTWLAGARIGDPAQDRSLDWLEIEPVLDLGAFRPGAGGLAAVALIRLASGTSPD